MSKVRWALVMAGVVAVLWAGCSAEGGPPGPSASGPSTPGAGPDARERAIVVTTSITVVSIPRAVTSIRDAVQDVGGYVAHSAEGREHARVELRVPATELDTTRARLATLGHVTANTETAEDVTLAHADVRASLASAQAEEARLTEMYRDRTANLADVLAVEHELSRVRGEIARADAAERVLTDRVAMAHIDLDLDCDTPAFTSDPVAFVAASAVAGVHGAGTLMLLSAAAVAALSPSALAIAALVMLVRWIRGLRARAART